MFRFEHAEYLYLLVLVALLPALYYLAQRARHNIIQRFGSAELIARLMPDRAPQKLYWKLGVSTLAFAALVIALANPQLGSKREMVKSQGIDVFIALDLSQSMLSQDLAPSRLTRAQQFGEGLARALRGNKIGLIVFAGNAYLQVPLTTDYAAVAAFLQLANPAMLPDQGTEISAALDLAARSFSKKDNAKKAVIVISDGENHEEAAIDRVRALRKDGGYLFAVGVGTREGSLIPVEVDGRIDYKRDETGAPVRSVFNETLLQNLAQEGQGAYFNLTAGSEEVLEALRVQIDRIEKRALEQRVFSTYESYFQIFLVLAIFLFMLELLISNRRSPLRTTVVPVIGILLLATAVHPTQAQSGHTLLREADKKYQREDFSAAEAQYRKALSKTNTAQGRYNLGNAIYQQKRYPEAVDHYTQAAERAKSPSEKAAAYYNLGNALFQMQDFEKSVEAYKKALLQNPADIQSKANLELARRQLKQQQQQNQQQQSQQPQNQQNQQNQQKNPQPQQQPQPPKADGQQPPPKSDEQRSSSKQEASGLSQREAEDLLRIAEEEEKRVQSKMRKGQGSPAKSKKDW